MKTACYLATPISTDDPRVIASRVEQTAELINFLLLQQIIAYAPILHYALSYQPSIPRHWSFWLAPSFTMLHRCDYLVVYCLPNWSRSTGVKAEINEARGKDKKVYFIERNYRGMIINKSDGTVTSDVIDAESALRLYGE